MRNDAKVRFLGLLSVVMGAIFFVASGFVLERGSPNGACDFEPVYYHARFLVQRQDPYAEGPEKYRQLIKSGFFNAKSVTGVADLPCVYPPTALLLAAPLALLTWHPAHLIWMGLIAGCLVVSAFVMWKVAARDAPILSGILIGFILANSSTVLFEANAAGIVVGLCILAVAFIFKRRFGFLAVVCLTIGLCMKPHDAFLIWLYLVLAGGSYRRRALQALILTCAVGAVAIVWVSSVSPHWRQELAANIAGISSRGGVNDPGPNTATPLITNSAVNLQTVFAVIKDEPGFYNTASYLLNGGLLLVWAVATIRHPACEPRSWLAIAVAASITLLPVYHRHHDAKLLLLAIPACASLWAQGRQAGRVGVALLMAALALTGDIPRAILALLEQGHVFSATSMAGKLEMISLVRPVPLFLLILGCFYLWIYARITFQSVGTGVLNRAEAITTKK